MTNYAWDNVTYSVNYNDVNWTVVDALDEDIVLEDSSRDVSIIVLGTIFTLAILGNAVVVVVLLTKYFKRESIPDVTSTGSDDHFQASRAKSRMRLTSMQWFMLLLSLADIFGAFFTILPQIIMEVVQDFHGNNFVCKCVKYLQVVAIYASTYCMLMLAIDLYITVCKSSGTPQKPSKRVLIMTSLAWGLSAIFALPQIFIFSLKEFIPGRWQCLAIFSPLWTLKLYVMFFTVITFLAPIAILVFCYARICCQIRYATYRNNMEQARHRSPRTVVFRPPANGGERFFNPDEMLLDRRRSPASEGKRRMLKMSLTIIITYIICWAPFLIVNLWAAFDHEATFPVTAFAVIMRMANLNSCTNPWIYLFFSALWRKTPNNSVLQSFMRLESPPTSRSDDVELGSVNIDGQL
ncbi:cephalotocin receptor 1-like [Liolophura sinensis]|uniref:cephalotocin receptor 1-like n=1 Tax=Liolophura sinensis TaxID=3198878 RepID=UPI0031588A21